MSLVRFGKHTVNPRLEICMGRMRADPAGDLVPCGGDRNKIHRDDRTGRGVPS